MTAILCLGLLWLFQAQPPAYKVTIKARSGLETTVLLPPKFARIKTLKGRTAYLDLYLDKLRHFHDPVILSSKAAVD